MATRKRYVVLHAFPRKGVWITRRTQDQVADFPAAERKRLVEAGLVREIGDGPAVPTDTQPEPRSDDQEDTEA